MRRVNKLWTDAQMEHLKALVAAGVSPLRASVILRRTQMSVQSKARQVGSPFPSMTVERTKLRQLLGTSRW
jgi:hypothetical protein